MIQKCEICKENGKILIKNARKSKFQKTLPVKIRLPWKRQIAWTKICLTKLLPVKF